MEDVKIKKQIEWIDVLKGIGIILVVFAHLKIPDYLKIYIYSFHMPLFFFISGYLINLNRNVKPIDYICKKVNSLLIPFFIFNLAGIICDAISDIILGRQLSSIKQVISELFCLQGYVGFNEPTWFLICLFIIEITAYLLFNNKSYDMKLIFGISVVVGCACVFLSKILPFQMHAVLICFPFFVFGHIIKKKQIINRFANKQIYIFVLIFMLLSVLFSSLNGRIDIYSCRINNPIYMYLSAFSGIMLFAVIAFKINKNYFLTFFGRNSLFIMGTHYFLFYAYNFLGTYILHYKFMHSCTIPVAILITIITLFINIPFICLTNKYFPIIVGKKRA